MHRYTYIISYTVYSPELFTLTAERLLRQLLATNMHLTFFYVFQDSLQNSWSYVHYFHTSGIFTKVILLQSVNNCNALEILNFPVSVDGESSDFFSARRTLLTQLCFISGLKLSAEERVLPKSQGSLMWRKGVCWICAQKKTELGHKPLWHYF